MDFETNFPIECIEDIFRHLSGSELLKCTLVCPEWNNNIGSTRSSMEKIKFLCPRPSKLCFEEVKSILKHAIFSFENKFSLEYKKNILKNSKRKYLFLKLKYVDYSSEMPQILSVDGKAWPHVVCNVHFETSNQFLELLSSFQVSVEKLYLCNAYVHENKFTFSSYNFQFP